MQIDRTALADLEARKLVRVITHPTADLRLANYTPDAQYGNLFPHFPLLAHCRGIIFTTDGTVVAKPFKKFSNLGSETHTNVRTLSTYGVPEITEKLDGSMICLYPVDGGIDFATRGSFTSSQAAMARAIWQERHAGAALDPRVTYLFELLGPENRIVVYYPETELRLLGLVDVATGEEYGHVRTKAEGKRLGFPVVPAVDVADWRDLSAVERKNFEGYVLHWPDQQLRVKIKLAEYVRLHRIITGLDERSVHEVLASGRDLAALRQDIPDELYAWFDGVARALVDQFNETQERVEDALARLRATGLNPSDREDRKQLATHVMLDYPDLRAPLFAALSAKPYEPILWKELTPGAALPA